MKENLRAGFWRRLLARAVDLVLVALFSVLLAHFLTESKGNISHFTKPIYFYIWSGFTLLLVFLFMIAIPLITKGQSLGYMLLKIKVVSENVRKSILIRESFFGFAWMIIILLVMTIINNQLISVLAKIKSEIRVNKTESPAGLSSWEKTRITLVGSISGLVTFVQMFLAISIIPNAKKQGWHDKAAECEVIITNKSILIPQEIDLELEPVEIKVKKYTWIEGGK